MNEYYEDEDEEPEPEPEPKTLEELVEDFCDDWSVSNFCRSNELSYIEALKLLTSPEAQEHIDEISRLQEKLFSRLSPYVIPQILMQRLCTAHSATESAAVLNALSKWNQEAPPPSDRDTVRRVMSIIRDGDRDRDEEGKKAV